MQLDATTLHTLTFVGSDSIHTTPLLRYPKSLPRGKNIFPKARLASHGIQAQTRNVPEAVQWGLPKLKRLTGKSDHRFVSASPVDSPVTMPWSLAIHLGLDSGNPYIHSEITRRGQALPSAWARWAEEGIDSAITGNRQGKLRVYLDEKSIFDSKHAISSGGSLLWEDEWREDIRRPFLQKLLKQD
ncbi:hypothetical protein VB005_03306 [Metarhizium brunneum]